MDLLDVVIFAAVCFFAYSGWKRGITWVGLSLIGLILGVFLGAFMAPRLARFFTQSATLRPTLTTGLFFAIILIVQGIGTAVGFRFRLKTLRTSFAESDSLLGSVAAVLGVFIVSWYLGITFAHSRWTYLDNQINGSFTVRFLAAFAPQPPAYLAQIEHAIGGSDAPDPFAGLEQITLPTEAIPPGSSIDTPGIHFSTDNTAKVISQIPSSQSCTGAEAGSGFAISTDYLVTNAHVVAAGTQFTVITPDGNSHTDVTVVLFDADTDVAILHVPDLGMKPLTILADDPKSGVTGAVIGYPGGGDEKAVPMAVRGTEHAQGFNIYADQYVTRDIVVVAGQIIPGNSGGPLVDNNGDVIGLVFAESTASPGQEGYALSIPQIAPDLQSGVTKTAAVSTEGCTQG